MFEALRPCELTALGNHWYTFLISALLKIKMFPRFFFVPFWKFQDSVKIRSIVDCKDFTTSQVFSFLRHENAQDIKVALTFSKFFCCWLHSKNLHFASASVNFGYWLWKKVHRKKKEQFLVIFDVPIKDGIFISFICFWVFLASLKSGNDFLYSQHGRSTCRSKAASGRKKWKFWLFLKIWKFSKLIFFAS